MIRRITTVALFMGLAACSSRDSDLENFLEQAKQEPPGGIQPLPEVRPYDSFKYEPAGIRSPFAPGTKLGANAGVRPSSNRNRQFLENYPLDSLKMGGTMTCKGGRLCGLVMTNDKKVFQVLPGEYLGQNDGKITKIEPSKISIDEIVSDGLGGYMERSTALTLND